MATNRHISLPKTFASGDASEWFKRFEICCAANEWDDATKAVKLPTLLEGEALAVWLELSEAEQKDYKESKKLIVGKMAPQSFVSLGDFHKRRLHPGEPISVYVHELKKLLDQAIPNLEKSAREKFLLHQFLAGIPNDVSKPIRAATDVKSLEQATDRARLLMAVDSNTPLHTTTAAISGDSAQSEFDELKSQISELTEQVAMLSASQQRSLPRQMKWCTNCGGFGHFQRNCPTPRAFGNARCCFKCGKTGHIKRNCPESGNDQGTTVMGNSRPRKRV